MKPVACGIAAMVVAMLAGCLAPAPAPYEPSAARLFLETKPSEDGVAVVLPESGAHIAIGAKPVFLETDIVNAEMVQVDLGRCLLLQLTPAAARDLFRLSAAALGRRLVLSVDGQFVGARRIEQPLVDGWVLVFVEIPDERLPALVARLNRASSTLASSDRPPARD